MPRSTTSTSSSIATVRSAFSKIVECDEVIKDMRRYDGKYDFLVPVVPNTIFKLFQERRKPCIWLLQRNYKSLILPTTPNKLQRHLAEICETCHKSKQSLCLLISREVVLEAFDVTESISKLRITHCGHSQAKDILLIHRDSTFCDTPLGQWDREGPDGHALRLGRGVAVDMLPTQADTSNKYAHSSQGHVDDETTLYEPSTLPPKTAYVEDWNEQVRNLASQEQQASSSGAPKVVMFGFSFETPKIPYILDEPLKINAGYYSRS